MTEHPTPRAPGLKVVQPGEGRAGDLFLGFDVIFRSTLPTPGERCPSSSTTSPGA